MNLRSWIFFNSAPTAQKGARSVDRRPKGKPTAHWARCWVFPKSRQRRTAGGYTLLKATLDTMDKSMRA